MKKSLLILFACLLLVRLTQAQDIITKRTGEDIQARVFEVSPTEIKYKRFDNIGGPTFVLHRSEVVMIRYENGSKELFNDTPGPAVAEPAVSVPGPAVTAIQMYKMGQQDAGLYYQGYKTAGTITLVTSLIMPLAGLVPAIATSATTPKMHNLGYPSTELMNNQDYRNGYLQKAKKTKSKKVWTNWGIGLGANIFFIILTR